MREVTETGMGDDERSGQIRISVVLPGLAIDVIEEALRRSQTENDGAIAQWLVRTLG
ncbi:hypothetical protein BH23CYA1_BH23CYA1_19610 [soil metagenome]